MSVEETITPDFKRRVLNQLQEAWPDPLSITTLSEELGESRERTRLALRELHQRGYVSQTADWNYRATNPSE